MPQIESSTNYGSTKILLISLAALCALGTRVYFAFRGHNYDMESFWLVSGLTLNGESVYASTHRYNYGPIWLLIVSLLRWCLLQLGYDSILAFHVAISSVLAIVDIAIAVALIRWVNLGAGLFFLMNPVSALVSGFHSQFDNFAILLGIIGVKLFFAGGSRSSTYAIIAGVVFGASLSTKHMLVFLPLWIVGITSYPFLSRVLFASTAYLTFLLTFVPWAIEPNALNGILNNVFRYSGLWPSNSLLWHLLELVLPWGYLLSQTSPLIHSALSTLLIITFAQISRQVTEWPKVLGLYLLTVSIFLPSLAPQYLAIPLFGVALCWRSPFAYLYLASATIAFLLTAPIGFLPAEHMIFDGANSPFYRAHFWLIPLLWILHKHECE